MPVYHFTLHAYRSWSPDNPRGFLRKNRKGVQPPNRALAHAYNNAANFDPILFTPDRQQLLLWATYDVCTNRNWRLHSFASDPTHIHSVVSWTTPHRWTEVRGKIKNILSLLMTRHHDERRPWFVEEGSRKRVLNQDHFDYLLDVYHPSHLGLRWREGDESPTHPPFKAKPPTPVGGYCSAQCRF